MAPIPSFGLSLVRKRSCVIVSKPAAAHTWAIPPPICPLPTTPTLRMSSETPPQGNQLLIAEIRRAIERAGGRIPFRDYMELALYHPLYGYYSAPGEKTGRGGDYFTAPQLSPLFGECLARFIGSGP